MTKLILFSSLPLLLPATCWTVECGCDWLCPMVGMSGCIALAGIGAAGLFVGLTFIQEMVGLDSIRD